jgi:hypothetical protein
LFCGGALVHMLPLNISLIALEVIKHVALAVSEPIQIIFILPDKLIYGALVDGVLSTFRFVYKLSFLALFEQIILFLLILRLIVLVVVFTKI